jgi:hypothetical protein
MLENRVIAAKILTAETLLLMYTTARNDMNLRHRPLFSPPHDGGDRIMMEEKNSPLGTDKTKGEVKMAVIVFNVLTIGDAEEAIAETWRVLEEYGIPSPEMTFSFRGRSRVKIALRVDDPVDALTLMPRLAPLGAVVPRSPGVPPKMQPRRSLRALISSVGSARCLRSSHHGQRRPYSTLRLS